MKKQRAPTTDRSTLVIATHLALVAGALASTACVRTLGLQPVIAHEPMTPRSLPEASLSDAVPSVRTPLGEQIRMTSRITVPSPSLASDSPSVPIVPSVPVRDASDSAKPGRVAGVSAPVTIVPGPVVVFSFAHSEPVLTCTVLRACVVELEPGELLVNEPIAGDQVRWIITTAKTGKHGASALVVVKPKACDISTNLVLSTDRRIYDLDLDSPACPTPSTNPRQAFTRHIRFSYPDEAPRSATSAAASASRSVAAITDKEVRSDSTTPGSSASLAPVNRDYRVVRVRRGPFGLFGRKPVDFPWRPTSIRDDGAHVYLGLPPNARRHGAPVLFELEDDGSRTIVNYSMRDTVIISDRMFRRGILVLASGGTERRLEFENRAWNARSDSTRRD